MDKEEKILKFWKEHKIFEKSEERGTEPFTFYDGPPFASGLPHYGHLLASAIKDAIPRYQVMRGKKTHRRFGWDCHGLPVENIVEKELDLKVKKDIEDYGIDKFNKAAKETVTRFTDDWKEIIPRFGRFVDMENDYRTMDTSYTESVWWVFKTLYDKGLIYEGYKSMHLCPRCETTLANFEVNQGYKDITDISVTVKFELVDEPGTFLLAWTTTPWTLPGNVALAVGADIEYVYARKDEKLFILAKDRAESVLKDGYTVEKTVKGSDLVGKKYTPVFDYYAHDTTLKNCERGWQVYAADFVTTEEGTGVVHIAPAFGEDDYALSQKENLPFVQHVSPDGKMKPEVTDFAGELVKPKDDHQRTDILVLKYLAEKGLLFAKEKLVHSYPHCWRCDTPLLNYAASSWFVKVTDIKDELVRANNEVTWVPSHIKEGRFGKWLEGARDWAISRSRFWGAPIPVWKCEECGELKVIGTIDDLAQFCPSPNTYFAMRHGQSESNVESYISTLPDSPDHITDEGQREVEEAAQALTGKGIDLIVSSPFVRTRETTEIVQRVLGLAADAVIFDARLGELNAKDGQGQSWSTHLARYGSRINRFLLHLGEEENYADVQARVSELLYDLDAQYRGKTILLVSHGLPLFLLQATTQHLSHQDIAQIPNVGGVFKNAEVRALSFSPLPHDEHYQLDVHRPHIDSVTTQCSRLSGGQACGGVMRRVSDVFDCWFESGAMPYGQAHYLGTPQKTFDPVHAVGFPTDFIAEGLDQTRGWFYSLLVLSTALFNKPPYKHVVVNGLILAEDGQKMSKKLKNYPDPLDIIHRYGADALRYYLLSSPVVHAEDLNFSERGVADVYRKNVVRLQNVLSFYNTFARDITPIQKESAHVLDRWIRARLATLSAQMTDGFESYELDRAVKPITEFIDDLSTWYLRRSRERIKRNDADAGAAVYTLGSTLKTLALLIAPIMPFSAEEIFQELKDEGDAESVHVSSWPTLGTPDVDVLTVMSEVRTVVSAALELRAESGIKVRQPLASLTIPQLFPEEYAVLIRDEVNVKEVLSGASLTLDTVLTDALIEEGRIREVVRVLQDARKEALCSPKAQVAATLRTADASLRELIERSASSIKRDALVHTLLVQDGEGPELSVHITP